MNERQRRLRIIAVLCAAEVVANFIVANVVVDDFSEVADVWWVLSFLIGFVLVGMIGVVAAVLLFRDRRNAQLDSD